MRGSALLLTYEGVKGTGVLRGVNRITLIQNLATILNIHQSQIHKQMMKKQMCRLKDLAPWSVASGKKTMAGILI